LNHSVDGAHQKETEKQRKENFLVHEITMNVVLNCISTNRLA
jgi:hypothetical protein